MEKIIMRASATSAAVIALALLAFGSASAQDRGHRFDPQRAEARKELHQSLKSWARTNVLPELRAWKARLDGAMSPEDLRALNDLRARAATLRKERAAIGSKMREAWKSEDYSALKSNRERMKEFKGEQKKLMEDLRPLAQEYRNMLEQIGNDAKPKIEAWKNDARGIIERWMQSHKDQLDKGGKPFHGMPGMRQFHGFGHGHGQKAMVARFMLWDGSDFIDQAEQMFNGGAEGGMPELK